MIHHAQTQAAEDAMTTATTAGRSKVKRCLTLLTEVTGQAVIQVFVEVCAVSLLQPGAQAEVRQLHVTLNQHRALR